MMERKNQVRFPASPSPQVDALLLNTSITSVSNISSLRDVVNNAISAAVANNPVAIQEAIAQVRLRRGQRS